MYKEGAGRYQERYRELSGIFSSHSIVSMMYIYNNTCFNILTLVFYITWALFLLFLDLDDDEPHPSSDFLLPLLTVGWRAVEGGELGSKNRLFIENVSSLLLFASILLLLSWDISSNDFSIALICSIHELKSHILNVIPSVLQKYAPPPWEEGINCLMWTKKISFMFDKVIYAGQFLGIFRYFGLLLLKRRSR